MKRGLAPLGFVLAACGGAPPPTSDLPRLAIVDLQFFEGKDRVAWLHADGRLETTETATHASHSFGKLDARGRITGGPRSARLLLDGSIVDERGTLSRFHLHDDVLLLEDHRFTIDHDGAVLLDERVPAAPNARLRVTGAVDRYTRQTALLIFALLATTAPPGQLF